VFIIFGRCRFVYIFLLVFFLGLSLISASDSLSNNNSDFSDNDLDCDVLVDESFNNPNDVGSNIYVSSLNGDDFNGDVLVDESFNNPNDVGSNIYVSSLNGDDFNGDGSESSPYASLNRAISKTSNGSTIYLNSGVYNSSNDRGLYVDNCIKIVGLSNNVVLDANNNSYFFKINNNASLVLDNLIFINGYSSMYDDVNSIFLNEGTLIVNNSFFNKMDSFLGTILNKGLLKVYNSNFSNCKSSNYGSLVSNIAESYFYNSSLYGSVYNCANISFFNCSLNQFNSNHAYNNYNKINGTFVFADLLFVDSFTLTGVDNLVVKNSVFGSNPSITHSNASLFNISSDSFYGSLKVEDSNVLAYGSIFNNVLANNAFLNVSHSVILGSVNGNGKGSLNYNWWGNNKGPNIFQGSFDAKYWVVMTFTSKETPIVVGSNTDFIVSLSKYTDGVNMYDLYDTSFLNSRFVTFESENGFFNPKSGYLVNGSFVTNLIYNNESIMVYAILDSQRLRLVVGDGSTDYSWFVSPDGHDTFGDGSEEYPYKTLSHVISKSLTGNTIYLLNGTYENAWNANLIIDKNVTLVGLGSVVLSRPNALNFFIVREWGVLNIFNINFTVNMIDYINSLFILEGGIINIYDSNFYNIRTNNGIINSVSGVYLKGSVNIFNSSFKNIVGACILGSASVFVMNSNFTLITGYYGSDGYKDYNYCISVYNNITVLNSIFENNNAGVVKCNPSIYSSYSMLTILYDTYDVNTYDNYVLIQNSDFINNDWVSSISGRAGIAVTSPYSNIWSLVDQCYFYNNKGYLVSSNIISNSSFTKNKGKGVFSDTIISSSFINNSNLGMNLEGAYDGTGVASAKTVLNSSFINNNAAYGGALYNPNVVHYCVFVDNAAYYWGDDIYSYKVDVDCSSNWWGSNQKPDNDRIYVFLASLTINDWIIMSLERKGNEIIASLDSLVDNSKNIKSLNFIIPSRIANFSSDFGIVSPTIVTLFKNKAITFITFNDTSDDFNVYATIDHQTLDLTIHNDNTKLLMNDIVVYGKDNLYNISLINVNGHRIFNQTLIVNIFNRYGLYESFTLVTDEYGFASFKVDYPVGEYTVYVSYGGNGYFKSVNNSSKISVLSSLTKLVSYNYTFYGKNNNFYVVLADENGQGLVNYTIVISVIDSKGFSRNFTGVTGSGGRADFILNLDIGEYIIKCFFNGNSWYSSSSSKSKVVVLPVNSTIIVSNITLYGVGNVYKIILKDSFGNVIVGEVVKVTISDGSKSETFDVLTDDKGVASITINLLPGKYEVVAFYPGDNIYGAAKGKAILVVEKINTIIFSVFNVVIPVNGFYTVILSDMHGRRIAGETVTLKIFQKNLIKTLTGVTDGFGEVNFKIDLPEGNYIVIIEYNGGSWYLNSTGAGNFIINNDVILKEVSINATDFVQYYGEDKYFVISFNDLNAFSLYGKTISVTISSGTWSQSYELLTDVFGFARLQVTLNPGVYNISYSYKNPFYGLYASDFNSILVYRMPTTIFASDMILNRGEARYLDIKLVDINGRAVKNMKVSLNISGILHNVTTNADGVARLMISLDPGEYVASFSFSNPSYLPSNGTSKILVVDSDKTSTKLEGNDVNSYDNETLNYTVILSDLLGNGIVGATVYLDVMGSDGSLIGTYHITTNSKGEGIFKLDLDYGSYIFKSYYNGNDKQLASFVSNFVNVDVSGNRIKTIIRGEDSVLNYSDDKAKFYVVLTDSEGNLLIGKEIIFKIGNITYKSVTDNSGRAYLDVSLKIGIYKVIVTFNGEGNFTRANNYYYLSVSSGLTVLEGNDLILFFKNGSYYVVRLTDNKGNSLVNRSIIFNINGNNYTRVTDNDGYAKIAINLNPGKYEISATYNDNESVAFKRSIITVLPTIEGNNLVKYFRNGSQFHVKILDGTGKPIANIEVTMNINGVMYKRITNSEGIATLAINLNPRNYTITVIDPNNNLQMSYLIQVLSTIQGSNLEKIYKNGSQYHVKILDDNGNPLVNRSVRMNINGVFYTRTTNSEGVATLSINLFPSTYTITVYHPDNNQTYSNTIKVLPSLTAYDLTLNHKDGSKFQAKLVDGVGKPVVNTNITFNINGVFYTRLTDDLGIARLTINLDPGHYVITSSYDGYSTSNKIDVKTL